VRSVTFKIVNEGGNAVNDRETACWEVGAAVAWGIHSFPLPFLLSPVSWDSGDGWSNPRSDSDSSGDSTRGSFAFFRCHWLWGGDSSLALERLRLCRFLEKVGSESLPPGPTVSAQSSTEYVALSAERWPRSDRAGYVSRISTCHYLERQGISGETREQNQSRRAILLEEVGPFSFGLGAEIGHFLKRSGAAYGGSRTCDGQISSRQTPPSLRCLRHGMNHRGHLKRLQCSAHHQSQNTLLQHYPLGQ